MLGNFLYFHCRLLFHKNSFRITIRESNSLDPDQDQHSIGPDLGPNCLQRLSAGKKKSCRKKKRKELTLSPLVPIFYSLLMRCANSLEGPGSDLINIRPDLEPHCLTH